MQYQSNIKADLNVHVILKGFDTYSYSYFLKNVLISLWRITLNKDIKNIQVSKVKYMKSFFYLIIFFKAIFKANTKEYRSNQQKKNVGVNKFKQ